MKKHPTPWKLTRDPYTIGYKRVEDKWGVGVPGLNAHTSERERLSILRFIVRAVNAQEGKK